MVFFSCFDSATVQAPSQDMFHRSRLYNKWLAEEVLFLTSKAVRASALPGLSSGVSNSSMNWEIQSASLSASLLCIYSWRSARRSKPDSGRDSQTHIAASHCMERETPITNPSFAEPSELRACVSSFRAASCRAVDKSRPLALAFSLSRGA